MSTAASQYTSVVLLGSPVIAGSAAWLAGRLRRWDLEEWAATGVRDRPLFAASALVPAAATGAVAYLLIALAAQLVCWLCGGYGPGVVLAPHSWLVMLAVVASALVWACVGTFIGTRMSPWIAMPLAAMATYAFHAAAVLAGNSGPLKGLVIYSADYWTYVQQDPWQLGVLGISWSMLGTLALASVLALRRLRLATGWGVSATMALALLIASPPHKLPEANAVMCHQGGVRVCVDRAHAASLEGYGRLASELVQGTPLPVRPHAVYQDSAIKQVDDDAGAGVVVPLTNGNAQPAFLADRSQTAVVFGEAVFLGACRGEPPVTSSGAYLWWLGSQRVPFSLAPVVGARNLADYADDKRVTAVAQTLGRLAASQRQAWFERSARALRSCTPTRPPELPSP